jgi:hypothetical protein
MYSYLYNLRAMVGLVVLSAGDIVFLHVHSLHFLLYDVCGRKGVGGESEPGGEKEDFCIAEEGSY